MRQLGGPAAAAVLWLADRAPAEVRPTPPGAAVRHLGSEHRLVVCNLHRGFHPDAFAAALGTLRGGGDCVVLAPPLADWADFADPGQARFASYPYTPGDMRGTFLGRLARLWPADSAVTVIGPDDVLALRWAPPAGGPLRLTAGQKTAVAAVERVALGHARRPVVLTADRGRGKSTVLGLAAARLLDGPVREITVIAPHRAAAATLFHHAAGPEGRGDPVADRRIGRGVLRFRQPAAFLHELDGSAGLVLVDEAAAIPVAVLREILERHNRLVFASTVHGYEGSGRGFAIRFKAVLDRAMPQWRRCELTEPVRWNAGDALEALIDRSMLLDTEPVELAAGWIPPRDIAKLDPVALAADEPLLRAVFGLLVDAHYQTRPSDLRQLLDDPALHLWVARQQGAVVGVLTAVTEGGFEAGMADAIAAGRRRPHGHLLPQSLAVHAGLHEVLAQRVLRVQRIAVHPQARRRGVGRRLLGAAGAWSRAAGMDAVGSAFGGDRPLLAFWGACGYRPQRLGVRIDPASAVHSVFVLRGLSTRGKALAALGCARFRAQLPWALGGSLAAVDSGLAADLLRGRDCTDLVWTARDGRELAQVAAGARPVASAEALVWKGLVRAAADGATATASLAPLIAWRLQRRPAGQVCRDHGLAGRRVLEACLREVLASSLTGRDRPG